MNITYKNVIPNKISFADIKVYDLFICNTWSDIDNAKSIMNRVCLKTGDKQFTVLDCGSNRYITVDTKLFMVIPVKSYKFEVEY